MEIDLIAGLIKPKIALTELPMLESPDLPEAALLDFAALLNNTIPDAASSPEAMPPHEMPAKQVMALSQELAPKLVPETPTIVSAELNTITAPENTMVAGTIAARPAPELPLAPLKIEVEVAGTRPAQPAAEASTINRIAIPTAPVPTVKGAEIAPVLAAPSETQVISTAEQSYGRVADLPTAVAPTNQLEAKPPTAVFSPVQIDKSSEPLRISKHDNTPTEKLSLPAKAPSPLAMQMAAPPAPTQGFADIEAVAEASEEIQFGLKIDRQAVETTGASRTTPQSTSVSSQISAQLPQLLIKAEKQTVELRLDPPELGRVTIHLTTNDQQVTATVVAERVDTVELMRRHAELLTATLARAGFSQADLSFQQGQGQNGKAEFEQFQGTNGLSEGDEPSASTPTLAGQDGRLDIRL